MPERARRKFIAPDNKRRLKRVGKARETRPRRAQRIRIRKRHILRKTKRPRRELRIQRVNFSVIADGRFLIRRSLAQRNISGRPFFRNLARVDLIGKVAVHNMLRPNGGPERDIRGISSANSSDDPIRFRKIKSGVEANCHNRSRSLRRSDAGQHAEHTFFVQARMVKGRRHGNDLIQVLALDPQLVFAGRVAGVLASFEHSDHDNFDRDRLGRSGRLSKSQRGETTQNRKRREEFLCETMHACSSPLDWTDMLCPRDERTIAQVGDVWSFLTMRKMDIQKLEMKARHGFPPPVFVSFLGLLVFFSGAVGAQTVNPRIAARSSEHEKRTARALEAVRTNPLELRSFLVSMPKGADLHNHLGGAVYAESWIRGAVEEHLCISLEQLAITEPPGGKSPDGAQTDCGPGKVPAAEALRDQRLYDALVDSFSMRGFVPSPGVTGHDHFFSTFAKFQSVYNPRMGEWLDEVATRAAAQNEQYLELMHTPEFGRTAALAKEIGWQDDFAKLRTELLRRGLSEDIALGKKSLDEAVSAQRQREHCGQPDQSAACQVKIRY